MAQAQKALVDRNSGRHNFEVLGKDKTQDLIETYEQLIAECESLISAYKGRPGPIGPIVLRSGDAFWRTREHCLHNCP
jgi:hypothetical protein